MALTDSHFCWCVPLVLLLVVTSAWIISSVSTASSDTQETQQSDQQAGDGTVNATVNLSAIKDLISQLGRSLSSPSSSKGECECPPPYERVMDQCYYLGSHHKLQWEEARQFCRGMGGDLAQPRHFTALYAHIINTNPTVGRWFLGGTDEEEEGVWQWIGGEEVPSEYWLEGEPNSGTVENCIDICLVCHDREHEYPSRPLNDARCSATLNFICEYVMADCTLP